MAPMADATSTHMSIHLAPRLAQPTEHGNELGMLEEAVAVHINLPEKFAHLHLAFAHGMAGRRGTARRGTHLCERTSERVCMACLRVW